MTFTRHDRRGQPGADVRAARRAAGRRLHQERRQRHRRRGGLRAHDLVGGGRARRRRERAVLRLVERLGDRGRWNRPARPVHDARDPAHGCRDEGPRPSSHDGRLRRQRRHARRRHGGDRQRGAQRHRRRPSRRARTRASSATTPSTPSNPRARRRRRRRSSASARSTTTGTRVQTTARRAIWTSSTRPSAGVDLDFELYDPRRHAVDADQRSSRYGGTGQIDRREYSGSRPSATSTGSRRDGRPRRPGPAGGPVLRRVLGRRGLARRAAARSSARSSSPRSGFGNDKFVEIKNDFDVPVDMDGAGARADPRRRRARASARSTMPTGARPVDDRPRGARLIVQADGLRDRLRLRPRSPRSRRAASGSSCSANGAIDVVDFAGVINSRGRGRALAPVRRGRPRRGRGCEQRRRQELVPHLRAPTARAPSATGATSTGSTRCSGGPRRPRAPRTAGLRRARREHPGEAELRAARAAGSLRGVNGLTGEGTADFVLPADASPRSNGTYVIADGVSGTTQVSPADRIWDSLDLNSPPWPDGTGAAGPARHPAARAEPAEHAAVHGLSRRLRVDHHRPGLQQPARQPARLPGRRGPGVHEQHRRRERRARQPLERRRHDLQREQRHGQQQDRLLPADRAEPGCPQHPARLLS